MKTKHPLLAAMLCATLAFEPVQIQADPTPPGQDLWLGICVIAVAGLAATGVYLVSHNCRPRYFWLMDDEKPPTFWVGAATRKECQINNWHRIGGPYEKPSDAPAIHPDATNRVELVASMPMTTETLASTNNGASWFVVDSQRCDPEDFAYFPTNSTSGTMLFKFSVSP